MESEVVVVDRGVSRYGLHRLHVLRMGAEIDLAELIEKLIPEEADVETHFQYEEEDIGIHHARVWWRMPEQRNDTDEVNDERGSETLDMPEP